MAFENPALSDAALQRAVANVPPSQRVGMSALTTYLITAALFGILLVAAAFGWSQTQVIQAPPTLAGAAQPIINPPVWLVPAMIAGVIIGIAGAFLARFSMITAPLYAICQGAVVGVISAVYNAQFPGIVAQAVLATLAVFAIMLVLYMTGLIKVSSRYVMAVFAGMMAIGILYLGTFLVSFFNPAIGEAVFGGGPLAIIIAIVVVGIASLNLPIQFDQVERVAKEGAPGYMAWYAAFGLMLAIVWLYVSLLRLLALTRR